MFDEHMIETKIIAVILACNKHKRNILMIVLSLSSAAPMKMIRNQINNVIQMNHDTVCLHFIERDKTCYELIGKMMIEFIWMHTKNK